MDVQQILAKIKQYPIAVGGGFLVLVMGVLLYLRGGMVPDLDRRYDELKAEIAVISANRDNAAGLESDVEAINDLLDAVTSELMVRDQRAINVNFFYELEEDLPVRLISVNQLDPAPTGGRGPKLPTELDNFEVITFKVVTEGTFENVLRFLYQIRTGAKLLKVRDVITLPSEAGPNQLSAELTIQALGKKPEDPKKS
ncbi:MAG: hypothetical protein ACFE0O_01335 [Opitutales bacterium]